MDDDDDLELASILAVSSSLALARVYNLRVGMRRLLADRRRHRRCGSLPGRMANLERDFDMGVQRIMMDYFGWERRPPLYGEDVFARRFRVGRDVFLEMYDQLCGRPFWRQDVNATGRPQSHPLQKLVGAFRVLAYGEGYDRADEYVRLSKATISMAVRKLINFLVEEYGGAYLRAPTETELREIMRRNEARGMPGCIGSIDCSHWRWRSCPTALHGQYQNRKGYRSIVMETVCDEDTYVWHMNVGAAGSNNDVNVLKLSPLYHAIVAGLWPPRTLNFTVNNRTRTMAYYLADGIYPRYAFFATPYPDADTHKKRVFNRLQEALRKDVERLYAVLTGRFHVLMHPARFTTIDKLRDAAHAVTILHNIMVKRNRHGYTGLRRMAALAAVGLEADAAAADGGPEGAAAGGAGGAAAGDVSDADQDAVGDHVVAGPVHNPVNAEGTLLYSLQARQQALDRDEHEMLRDDLAEHIFPNRHQFLLPYIEG